jgi:hypothetical protein
MTALFGPEIERKIFSVFRYLTGLRGEKTDEPGSQNLTDFRKVRGLLMRSTARGWHGIPLTCGSAIALSEPRIDLIPEVIDDARAAPMKRWPDASHAPLGEG